MEGEGDSESLNGQLSDNSDGDESWGEMEIEETVTFSCLFCSQTLQNSTEAISHCKNEHNLDFIKLKGQFNMDDYSFIKLVNFIRKKQNTPEEIMNMKFPSWIDEQYLIPVIENDPWLMLDFDDIEVPSGVNLEGPHVVNAENGCITLTEFHFLELQKTIQSLTLQLKEKDESLKNAFQDMERVQIFSQNLMKESEKQQTAQSTLEQSVKSINLNEDEGYFNSYAHFSIHHEMLSDDVRTSSYQNAILNNKEIFTNKDILDLGCGTSILSMFAASAGAKLVIGIDQSDIIYHAMDIIRENKLENKINLIKGRLEDTNLPIEKFDIIVSEWMGYFLLFEGMLDSVLYARDHCLKPDGILFPNKCSINLVGLADKARYASLIGFWNNVYGYKMTCLQKEVVKEPTIDVVNSEEVFTTSSILLELDLNTCKIENLNFCSEFTLEALRDDTLTALIGYFDIIFSLPNTVSFSTSPHDKPTHWKQTIFFLEKPIELKKGDTIKGKLICQRNIKDLRGLKVTIIIQNQKYKYIMG